MTQFLRSRPVRGSVRNALATTIIVAIALAVTGQSRAFDPASGDYAKDDPLDIRIMAYNTQGNFIADPTADPEFNRIITAINPDIISFEEIPSSLSASDIQTRLNTLRPVGGAGWQVYLGKLGGTRDVIASRFPLTLTRQDTIPVSSTRGVTIALVDLPNATYPVDIYVLSLHLKCCGNPGGSEDDSRQRSADAIANWLGDARGVARASGNNIVLPPDTPMFAMGDFNLVGGPQPENTIITGDIQDESTFGPDVHGDWDDSTLTDLVHIDPFTGDNFTWQGSSSFPPSRLDRMFYTDNVVTIVHSFTFNTDTMPAAVRTAIGVQAGDTLPQNSSDHLPIVADLRLVAPCPDADNDGECDATDGCPNDPLKTSPGRCGCGVVDAPADGDINADGAVNGADIAPFVEAAIAANPSQQAICHGDFDGNLAIDLDDADLLIDLIVTGG